jgi:hypothetical protein
VVNVSVGVYKSSASLNCMSFGDRARVATEFVFKAKCPMCLTYGESASRNCMIAWDRVRLANDLGLEEQAHVFRVREDCILQYMIVWDQARQPLNLNLEIICQ